ncbi:MAG: sel1 repeat family protein [Clostridia bacterium]|nr:sel1 repeat family protein [Clostridia bacterium]
MSKYIEEGTNYSYIVKRMKDVNFRSLRNVSVDFTKRLPEDLSSELYKDIQHGVCQLQSEPELNMYIHALGMMHEAKLQHAFEHLAIDFFSHSSIDIIDYGCGQAIGTICYADFLREKGYSQKVRKVTLIEPSELALKRAALHVSCFFPNAEIVTILKGFDDLIDDISVDGDVPTLHILSNVIDLADDCFNLEDFTTLIKKNIKGENHFVCIEPYFNYDEEDDKLQRFIELLDAEVYYRKVFTKGTFVEGREWTCNVAIGGKINKEILCKPKESSFDLKIKQLINNGAKLIKNCKVKNVAYSNNDGKIIVKFVLTEPIRDYVLCADGVNYKIGKTDIIYSSIYAVFEILLEDDTLGWLGNVILENPSVLNEVFQDAIVDVLQQEVFKGEEYINPFIENYKQKTIISDRNFIVNHCVKFYLSEAGEKVADDIMNVIFGYIDDNNIKILMDFANTAQDKNRNKEAFSYYKLAAKANYAEAQYRLGICYYYGNGISQDYLEAVKWYKKASEQGDANAQYNLGFCYEKGFGVEKDEKEAVKWYLKSAEQGNANAQCNLGFCYEKGFGVEKDEKEAVKWYLKSAEQGNVRAQFNLGVCYSKGRGVDKDELEMVEWYRKSAEQGYANAQCNLGFCYHNGRGVEKDEKEAINWYKKAAEQGNVTAQCNLGWCYKYGQGVSKNEEEAIKWYIKAAEQGDKKADEQLVDIVHNDRISIFFVLGNSDIKDNTNIWCFKAAQFGYANAQNAVGWYYYLKHNYAEAIRWYRKAIEQGHVRALYNLGVCYLNGHGFEKNEEEAIMLFCRAVEKDDAEAEYMLGFCYEKGIGVEQSYEEAAKYYLKAVDSGNEKAKSYLAKLYALGKGVEKSSTKAITLLSGYALKGQELYSFGCFYYWNKVEQSYEEAVKWWKLSAEENYVEAEYKLGDCYEKGYGVEQSYEEAVKWYIRAAEKGNKVAMSCLVDCYKYGRGVERSYRDAIKWNKALGCENMYDILKNVYDTNNPFVILLKMIKYSLWK